MLPVAPGTRRFVVKTEEQMVLVVCKKERRKKEERGAEKRDKTRFASAFTYLDLFKNATECNRMH